MRIIIDDVQVRRGETSVRWFLDPYTDLGSVLFVAPRGIVVRDTRAAANCRRAQGAYLLLDGVYVVQRRGAAIWQVEVGEELVIVRAAGDGEVVLVTRRAQYQTVREAWGALRGVAAVLDQAEDAELDAAMVAEEHAAINAEVVRLLVESETVDRPSPERQPAVEPEKGPSVWEHLSSDEDEDDSG